MLPNQHAPTLTHSNLLSHFYFSRAHCCTINLNYLQLLQFLPKNKKPPDRFMNVIWSIINTLKLTAFPYRACIITIQKCSMLYFHPFKVCSLPVIRSLVSKVLDLILVLFAEIKIQGMILEDFENCFLISSLNQHSVVWGFFSFFLLSGTISWDWWKHTNNMDANSILLGLEKKKVLVFNTEEPNLSQL